MPADAILTGTKVCQQEPLSRGAKWANFGPRVNTKGAEGKVASFRADKMDIPSNTAAGAMEGATAGSDQHRVKKSCYHNSPPLNFSKKQVI